MRRRQAILDPAGLVQVLVPIGFGPDLDASSIQRLIYRHYRLPGETLEVHLLPALVPGAAPQDWLEAVRKRWPMPAWRLVQPRPGESLHAAGEFSDAACTDRIHLARGPRLDALLVHRTMQETPPGAPSSWLSILAGTLAIPVNEGDAELAREEDVMALLKAAREAVEREDWLAVIPPAVQGYLLSTTTLVASVCYQPIPEIPAAFAAAQALLHFGQATGDILCLRQAEALTLRALSTLEEIPVLKASSRQHYSTQLGTFLDILGRMQAGMHPERADAYQSRSSTHRANARSEFCHQLARKRLEQDQAGAAVSLAEAAVQDLCAHAAWIANHPEDRPLPAALLDYFQLSDLPPADQVRRFQLILGRICDLELQERGGLLFALHEREDPERALEIATLLVPVSRRVARREAAAGGVIEPADDGERILARALIMEANARERFGDDRTLDEAWRRLKEAEQLLDQAGDEGLLRAWLCLTMAANRHARRVLPGSVEIADRGLRATENAPRAEKYRRELLTIKSQFLLLEGRPAEAAQAAAQARSLGREEVHPATRAAYDLNAALIAERAGNTGEAMELLRSGLRTAFEGDPRQEALLRILHVAAEIIRHRDPGLAVEIDSAALMIAEENRDAISDDQRRVIFGEASRWHEIHDRLVAHYADRDPVRTLEVIDRMRGRSLHRSIRPPAPRGKAMPDLRDNPLVASVEHLLPKPEAEYDATIPNPALDQPNPLDAFRSAARSLQARLSSRRRLEGDPEPLDGRAIEQAAGERGATILMIHPFHERTLLVTTHGPGQSVTRWVNLGRADLAELAERCWNGLGIQQGSRGRKGAEPSATATDEALEELHRHLIDPVADRLDPGRPLIISPYRELALLPFHLLKDSQGPLLDRFAISLAPSASVLGSASHVRDRPVSAYIVGDPETHDRWLLDRLPGARQEAKELADRLRGAGLPENSIVVREGLEATRESFFDEAAGRSIVHLACHGELGGPGEEPRLLLAPGPRTDGALQAPEIPAVRLNGALVFLSGCETGQGWPSADGVVGMGRAFLRAGAQTVIVSLWRANDLATRHLARVFYGALLDADEPVHAAEALRKAMQATRSALQAAQIRTDDGTPLEPAPANWAPFYVLGENLCFRRAGE